jgi:hypothetical protein
MRVIVLNHREQEELHGALLKAFPKIADLRRLMYFKLGVNLDEIASTNNLNECTLDLIQWSDRTGKTEELIFAALKEMPTNPYLARFAKNIGLSSADSNQKEKDGVEQNSFLYSENPHQQDHSLSGHHPSTDFFISYAYADQQWAEWIAWQLEKVGYTTVLRAWDFHTGGNFVLYIDTATKQAKRIIAVLSEDYFASHFTSPEWAVAFQRDPTGKQGILLPVRVRPCNVEGLMGSLVYIDLTGKDEQTAKTTLLARVKQERHKPTQAPAFPSITHTGPEGPTFPGALPPVRNNIDD